MRVAMLCDYPIPESLLPDPEPGQQRFLPTPVINLVESLTDGGLVQLDLIRFWRQSRRPETHALPNGATLHLLPAYTLTGMPVAFVPRTVMSKRLIKKLKPDVVHGQGTEAGYANMAVSSGLRHVITVHGILQITHQVNKPPRQSVENVGRWAEARTLRRARNVISISEFVESALAPLTHARFWRVANGVSNRFYEQEIVKTGRRKELVYLGRICPEKGLRDLIEAAGALEGQGDARVVVIGSPAGRDGPTYLRECQTLASQIKSIEFEWAGSLSDERALERVRHAAAIVLPSYDENFSMAVAEAMAAGTPAVVYASGALPERVDEGVSGFVVAPGDIRSLGQSAERLLSDLDLATKMGTEARRRAASWHQRQVAEETVAVYESICRAAWPPRH